MRTPKVSSAVQPGCMIWFVSKHKVISHLRCLGAESSYSVRERGPSSPSSSPAHSKHHVKVPWQSLVCMPGTCGARTHAALV